MEYEIEVTKQVNDAVMPTWDGAKWTLYASQFITIPPGKRAVVTTSLYIMVPDHCVALVQPVIGLRYSIYVMPGGKRSLVALPAYNERGEDIVVSPGTPIAYLTVKRAAP